MALNIKKFEDMKTKVRMNFEMSNEMFEKIDQIKRDLGVDWREFHEELYAQLLEQYLKKKKRA